MLKISDQVTAEMLDSPAAVTYVSDVLNDLPNLYDGQIAARLSEDDKRELRFYNSFLNCAIAFIKEEKQDVLKSLADKGYPRALEEYIILLEKENNPQLLRKYLYRLSENPYTVGGIRSIAKQKLKDLSFEQTAIQNCESPQTPSGEPTAKERPLKRAAFLETISGNASQKDIPSDAMTALYGKPVVDPTLYKLDRLPDLTSKNVSVSPAFIDMIGDPNSDLNRQISRCDEKTIEQMAIKGYPGAQYQIGEILFRKKQFKSAQTSLEACLKNPNASDAYHDKALDIYGRLPFHRLKKNQKNTDENTR